jgi:hypothetical protein
MAIREITLRTPAEWAVFAQLNPEIAEDFGDEATALHFAKNGGLECGGGATPLTIVYYVDAAVQARIDSDWEG